MTAPFTLAAIRSGAAATGVRAIPRQCTCPWKGPFPATRPVMWRRTSTDERCAIHSMRARAQRAHRHQQKGAADGLL